MNTRAAITLLPEHFASPGRLRKWMHLGLRWVELRDDLLSSAQFAFAAGIFPQRALLASFRDPARAAETYAFVRRNQIAFDWPIERGLSPGDPPSIYSLHTREHGISIRETLRAFPADLPSGTILKAALNVRTRAELAEGERWRQEDPRSRAFLPMSPDGRWAGYRLARAAHMPLAFVREGRGSSPDQPQLKAWALH